MHPASHPIHSVSPLENSPFHQRFRCPARIIEYPGSNSFLQPKLQLSSFVGCQRIQPLQCRPARRSSPPPSNPTYAKSQTSKAADTRNARISHGLNKSTHVGPVPVPRIQAPTGPPTRRQTPHVTKTANAGLGFWISLNIVDSQFGSFTPVPPRGTRARTLHHFSDIHALCTRTGNRGF